MLHIRHSLRLVGVPDQELHHPVLVRVEVVEAQVPVTEGVQAPAEVIQGAAEVVRELTQSENLILVHT